MTTSRTPGSLQVSKQARDLEDTVRASGWEIFSFLVIVVAVLYVLGAAVRGVL